MNPSPKQEKGGLEGSGGSYGPYEVWPKLFKGGDIGAYKREYYGAYSGGY